MAILKVFAVFDQAAKAYLRPFFTPTRGMALRGFMDAVSDPNHEFSKHASDYVLFELADFDEVSGSFKALGSPVKVGAAHELLTIKPIDSRAA